MRRVAALPLLAAIVVAGLLQVMEAAEQYPINLCTSYGNLCTSLQYKFQCPDPVNQVGCEGPTSLHSSYAAYDGQCACGGLNATRLEQNIVYHEINRANDKTPLLVAVAGNASATDFCASYQNTCSAFLNAIACPASQQANVGCETPGDYSSFVNECTCAGGAVDGSLEARNAIIEYLAKPAVEELTVYEAGEGNYLKLCPTFQNVCGHFLDQIQCPAADRVNAGCRMGNDYRTYAGKCMCGGIDAGDRVRRLVIDTYIGPQINMISTSFMTKTGIDFCNTFTWSCKQWLEGTIKCPKSMIFNENNCGSSSGMEIESFQGQCACGDIYAHQRIQDIILDTQINPILLKGLCGLNGACHPVRDVQLKRTTNVGGGGVFGILLSLFAIVIFTGLKFPHIWTCSRADH